VEFIVWYRPLASVMDPLPKTMDLMQIKEFPRVTVKRQRTDMMLIDVPEEDVDSFKWMLDQMAGWKISPNHKYTILS
jgi:hypothetical protein